jgi:hypothetical protein
MIRSHLGWATSARRPFAWVLLMSVMAAPAMALPSFARQTGAPCEQCHTVAFGPQLTPYGRLFKLNGYTWGTSKDVVPLALMVQATYTHTSAEQPEAPAEHYETNNNGSIDQVSLFYGGRLGDHAGLFAQVTYSGPDQAVSWDNLDLRYARTVAVGSHYAVLGATVNNNPTVQDLWNTTLAWGFPYVSSALAPTPSAAPMVTSLGGVVLGSSLYASVDGLVYLELGGYRGLSDRWLNNLGPGADASSHLLGTAPYARLALDKDVGAHHWHVGALRLDAEVQPDPTQPQRDRYIDDGVDAMYQYFNGGAHSLTVNALHIRETRQLDASVNLGGAAAAQGRLDTTSLEATYAFHSKYAATVGYFDIRGNSDAALYAPGGLSGSANGRPDSRGTVWQVEYIPFGKQDSPGRNWLNVRLGLQYTAYSTFNGAAQDYDGQGRNAADNNTLFAYAWFMF